MIKRYKWEVLEALEQTKGIKNEILTVDDISHLPQVVQKYIRYTGSIGKGKVKNFRVEFEGRIRSKPEDSWMRLKSVQYNFIDKPTRLFYITARKMGIPAGGLHMYKDEKAIMKIKIAGLFTVVDASGPEMDQGETVTLFNDMCFMAPATLIDRNIKWETIDNLTVRAQYTNGSITIGAILYFNETGELVNFISNDRYETTDGKTYHNYPWITPVTGYKESNGLMLASGAKAIYSHPDQDFCYGEFNIVSVEYNCRILK